VTSHGTAHQHHSPAVVVAAFAAVYIIWGSTYLAIRYAIETIPPFLMAGSRFVVAGAILYWLSRALGAERPRRGDWGTATMLGAMMFLGGNGGVVWAEQRVPSGLTALLIATEPLWISVMDWVRPGGSRPKWRVATGLMIGFAASVLLVAPGKASGGVDPIGALVLVIATLSWAAGSLYSRHARLPRSPLMAAGMQMIGGGILLFGLGSVTGEWAAFSVSGISARSLLSLGYLISFGAIVAFTSYSWLLKVTTPAKASTYAYVNPVIAVILGWGLAGEAVGPRTVFATVAIVAAVALISSHRPPVGEHAAITDSELQSGGVDEEPSFAGYEAPHV
jgi:drug/metabolite transporter (DMT)-like permease